MEGYGGPAQPSPTIEECLNGGPPVCLPLILPRRIVDVMREFVVMSCLRSI
jgi:hypothetical protein